MYTTTESAGFSAFRQAVLAHTRPLGIRVRFKAANGRYYGNCSDGNTFVGNPASDMICIKTFNGRVLPLPAQH